MIEGTVVSIQAKTFFAGFETGFTAFAVLFLALWRFFASIEGTVGKIRTKTFISQL